jgi:DNA-binding NtrC family response regulator
MDKIPILVISSNGDLSDALGRDLGESAALHQRATVDEAIADQDSCNAEVVVLDAGSVEPDAVTRLRECPDPPQVLMVSATPSIEEAVDAMSAGAAGYIELPLHAGKLLGAVERAVERRIEEQKDAALSRMASQAKRVHENIIAGSAEMQQLLERASVVGPSSSSLLITGETGSGKSLLARVIHRISPRRFKPFLTVNCAAMQESLLESELFGHERGSFTGAAYTKIGLFEVCHEGTLFLDEIGEMSPSMQAKLLQVLDTGELRRVGGTRMRPVDTRVITATNRDLAEEVREERFRKDLFFRLNVVRLRVPPLRTRKEDIPDLVEHFLRLYSPPGQEPKRIARRAVSLLMEYHWPGNVRELANMVEGLSILVPDSTIMPQHLPHNLQPATDFESRPIDTPIPLADLEKMHIARTLDFTKGKKALAARLLRIDVKTLNSKIQSYGIEV